VKLLTAPALESQRRSGGDSSVPRDRRDRPRIWVECPKCGGAGTIPSERVPGRLNQCSTCKREGRVLRSYTRVTTYIDAIDDKTNIGKNDMRRVLIGCAVDPSLLEGVLDHDPEERAGKDALEAIAEKAKDVGGGNDKSKRGTWKHDLSELIDRGEPLPAGVSYSDICDMDAYERSLRLFEKRHIERFVVVDELCVGGTPDRLLVWAADLPLTAPDGHVFGRDELIVGDLKTGSIEYSQLKFSMQLRVYSVGKWYDPKTGDRTPIENVNQDWGIVFHLPADTGRVDLYWADLKLGQRALELAGQIREFRSIGRKCLVPLDLPAQIV
jgi:hypothetical protein